MTSSERRTPLAAAFLLLAMTTALALPISPALAWNTGPGDTPTDADINHEAGEQYHRSPHVYIFEHAIEILRNDGNTNWADLAEQHLQDLADGARYADHCMGRGYIRVQLELFWGIVSKNLYETSYPLAGREHYYNPDREGQGNEGLDLSDVAGWSSFLDGFVKFLTMYALRAYTFTLADIDFDFDPSLRNQYPSAASLCQQKYDLGQQAFRQGKCEFQRGSLGTALFYLGWACHLVQDLGVPNHTHDSYLSNHQEYEDFADGKGGQPALHATSGGIYSFGMRAYDYASGCAKIGHQPNLFATVKGGDRSQWTSVLQTSLPAAERYTAGLIAKFMNELQIPAQTPPATFVTRWSSAPSGNALPGVYIFYRRDGETNWNLIRSDANGRFTLSCPAGVKFWIRPAMPGYSFHGSTQVATDDVLGAQCPIPYTQRAGVLAGTQGAIVMQKLPGPQMQVPNLGTPETAGTSLLRVPPEQMTMAQTGHLQLAATPPRATILAPGMSLTQSGTVVESGLEEEIRRAAIDLTSSSHVLGVDNSGTGLPTSAQVTVQVYELMSLLNAQVVSSGSQLVQTIDGARAQTMQVAMAATQQGGQQPAAAQLQAGAPQALLNPATFQTWQTVRSRLATREVMGGDNQQHQAFVIPGDDSSHFSGHTLLQNGVVPVPSLQGCQITVTPVGGYGYLNSATPSLSLQTGAGGRASFIVLAGNRAGKLRLKLTVNHPNLTFLQPEAFAEFVIHPALQGGDQGAPSPPSLMVPHMVAGGAQVMGSQPQILQVGRPLGGVERVRVRLDANHLYSLAGQQAAVLASGLGAGSVAQLPTLPMQQVPLQPTQPAQPTQPQQPAQQPGQPPRPIQPVGAGRSETFDGQPQGWELIEGATVAGGALTLNSPGQGIWLIEPAAHLSLSFRYRQGQGPGTIGLCMSGEPPQNQEYEVMLFPGEVIALRHQAGQIQELGGAQASLQPGAWTNVGIQIAQGTIQVSVGGQQVLSARDPNPLGPGIVRFGTHEGGGAAYDDIALQPGAGGTLAAGTADQSMAGVPAAGEQHQPAGQQPMPTPVQTAGRTLTESFDAHLQQGWELPPTAAVTNGALTFSGPGHAFWVTAQARDFTLRFRYRPGSEEAGVILCASGEPPHGQNYHLIMGPDHIALERVSGGQEQHLGDAQVSWQQGQWHTVTVQAVSGRIQVTVGAQQVLSAVDPQPLPQGAFGFGQLAGSGVAYDDINITISGPGAN
ncbi:MAG: family 16 glycoside hydrolase [Armatimonadota bacterium]